MTSRVLPPAWLVVRRRQKELRRRRRKLRAQRTAARQESRIAPTSSADGPRMLRAPDVFLLHTARGHESTVRFLRRLVDLTLTKRRDVCVDFRLVKRFYATATLLLYAELRRITQRRPGCVSCKVPKDPTAQQVLHHLGILKMLGCHKSYPSTRDDVTHWVTIHGVEVDASEIGPAIDGLRQLNPEQRSALFGSVSEALTNVTQHAYREPRMDGTGTATDRGWWMFVRPEPKQLIVAFCDLGLGLPYTVKQRFADTRWLIRGLQTVARAIGVHVHNDGETIMVTAQHRRSRLGAKHRGNGLQNIIHMVRTRKAGFVMLYGNRGSYRFSLDNGREEATSRNYRDSIYGTLITWLIPISED